MKEPVVLGRRARSMIGFRRSGKEPRDLNDLALALDFGATWEGDEDMDSLVWQMEHVSDDDMIDND